MKKSQSKSPLNRSILLAFIFPTVVLSIMHGPEALMQAIYAKHAGLPLAALAAAVLLTRLFDGVTYPLIGYLSDLSFNQSGTRRSWLIVGSLVSMLGVWFLLRPPGGVTVWYFGAWTAVTYLGWKIIEIPLQAWSYGLSDDYGQRARVQAWRAFASMGGYLLFFAMPFIAVKMGYSDSTELDFRSLGFAALICVWALPLASLLLIVTVHEGGSAQPAARERFGFREIIAAVKGNKPLIRLLIAFLPVTTLGNMSSGVSYLYIDTYLGLSKQFPAIMMVSLLATILGIPFWSALSARFERHRVWAVSLVCCGAGLASLALIPPGALALPLISVCYPLSTFCLSGSVIVFIISADIVDYGRLYTGQDHGGLYGSLFSFLQKSLLSVGTAAGVALVGLMGFDASASVHSADGVLGLKLISAIVPAVGLIGGAAIIWNFPLVRARTLEIQRELNERDGALKA